jgi:hypothetical protein
VNFTWEDVVAKKHQEEEIPMENYSELQSPINVAPNGVIDSMVNSERASGFV